MDGSIAFANPKDPHAEGTSIVGICWNIENWVHPSVDLAEVKNIWGGPGSEII